MFKNSKFKNNNKERFGSESVNPMDGVSNLADAMLVLAVGIMLSVIMAFNVDIGGNGDGSGSASGEQVDMQQIDSISSDDSQTLDDMDLQEYGKVYLGADGNYYIVEEEE